MKASFFTKNTGVLRQKIIVYIKKVKQWFVDTPERALLEAYKAAQTIRNIEIQHFGNEKISASSANYTENVMSYWQGYLQKQLTIINVRLAEFRLSRSMLNTSNNVILEKLHFIDDVISPYTLTNKQIGSSPIVQISEPLPITGNGVDNKADTSTTSINKITHVNQKTGFLPRSFGRTINKIQAELSPQAEEEFVASYQISRNRTRAAIRFLLLLILVPLITQHFSKQILINPIVERTRNENVTQFFLNSEMEDKALHEFKNYENKLKFEILLQQSPALSSEEIQGKFRDKAIEISQVFYHKSSIAISNVSADLLSLVAFGVVIAMSKKEIVIVKSFIDNVAYGLSDSAKAFIIILFTDTFVGFHSPYGWEVLLEGLAEHLGLPASKNAIFLFIATFPVILDTIFKYWIFRYLSRLSPSALATFKEVNE
ncbi:MAG: proton extrusion protein PcxA [Mojavia pulchra JT2-VF2]|jgi:hypothetical protein|uniref:Proton extrusion protein PxcA n=1 Tax=Mojavia pulchra JT2-VF2 TaxID=287848 RepID=A0A951Q3V0_9NOST|nr:proton extrusion protein PcxA [Mojavia pulchra JT2-VF2]